MPGDRGPQMWKGQVDASRGANAATGQGPKLGVHRITGGNWLLGTGWLPGGYLVGWELEWDGTHVTTLW